MNRADAASIVGDLKGLMPMLTDEQARFACDIIQRRDDPLPIRAAIRAYVADNAQFSIASFRACLPPDPHDRENIAQREHRLAVRAEGQRIDAQHAADNELCNSLNDETLARLELAAVAAETPEKRAVIGNRPGRRFQSVRTTIAALAKREGIVGLVGAR